eukprot:1217081-Pyramimonas_sp.AAC.1
MLCVVLFMFLDGSRPMLASTIFRGSLKWLACAQVRKCQGQVEPSSLARARRRLRVPGLVQQLVLSSSCAATFRA